jgi:hypothetical protein
MKSRYIVLGFSLVLVLAIAVPALGVPRQLRSGSSATKALAKKALKAAVAAQHLAEAAQNSVGTAQTTATAAQTTAGTAQGTAGTAQAAATSAKSAASTAQATAAVAKATAGTAQTAATEAQTTATAVETTANTALTAAQTASVLAASKFGGIKENSIVASSAGSGPNEKVGLVTCPGNSKVISGGFEITKGAAEPHFSKMRENGWVVAAQSGGNTFTMVVFAYCLES